MTARRHGGGGPTSRAPHAHRRPLCELQIFEAGARELERSGLRPSSCEATRARAATTRASGTLSSTCAPRSGARPGASNAMRSSCCRGVAARTQRPPQNRGRDGYYGLAVEESFKVINETAKERNRLRDDGAGLMRSAFGLKNPVLVFNALETESEVNEQLGYMEILAGCMTGIRKPAPTASSSARNAPHSPFAITRRETECTPRR